MSKAVNKKPQTDIHTRESIQDDIESFLKQGGKIEEVPTGVSGVVPQKGPRHIVIQSSKDK